MGNPTAKKAAAKKAAAAPVVDTAAPESNEPVAVEPLELSDEAFDVTQPLEGDAATSKINYDKTTMNVVNDVNKV